MENIRESIGNSVYELIKDPTHCSIVVSLGNKWWQLISYIPGDPLWILSYHLRSEIYFDLGFY